MLGLFLGLLLLTNFVEMGMSEKEINEAFAPFPYQPTHHFAEYNEGKLHYVTFGDKTKPILFFIHGSPGSWDAFIPQINETGLINDYYIVTIDRPGYGQTTLEGKYSLEEQSAFLRNAIEALPKNDLIIIGHSYGGALAMRAAIDYQDKVTGVISAAGTLADPYQNPKWYNYAMRYTPIQWLVKQDFAASDQEMWKLEKDLPKLDKLMSGFTKKAVIIQGDADMLVDPRSGQYAKEQLTNAEVKLVTKEDMNHFVIWSDKNLIVEAIQHILN